MHVHLANKIVSNFFCCISILHLFSYQKNMEKSYGQAVLLHMQIFWMEIIRAQQASTHTIVQFRWLFNKKLCGQDDGDTVSKWQCQRPLAQACHKHKFSTKGKKKSYIYYWEPKIYNMSNWPVTIVTNDQWQLQKPLKPSSSSSMLSSLSSSSLLMFIVPVCLYFTKVFYILKYNNT